MWSVRKDKRWNAWRCATKKYFGELAENLVLRPEVPEAVAKQYDLIKSTLRFSYYDYELTAVVFLLLGIAFEAAIRIKYEQSAEYVRSRRRKSLKGLIDWGISQGMFEEDSISLHAFREIRNIHAHQKEPVIFGITGMKSIDLVTNTINGIFDPRTSLRKKRLARISRFNHMFELASQHGMILSWEKLRLIVFKAQLLVYDNIHKPQKYYVAVWPIFEIDPKSNRVEEGRPIMIQSDSITSLKIEARTILFSDGSSLSPISNPDDQRKFSQWKQLYETSKFHLPYMINIKLAEMRHALMSEYIYSPD